MNFINIHFLLKSYVFFSLLYILYCCIYGVLYSPVNMHARLFSILTEVQCVVVAFTFSDVSVKVTLNTTDTSKRVIVELH